MRNDEVPISLSNAAKRSPGRPSSNAVWRWCRRGIKTRSGARIHLEHIRVGGKIFTTAEALDRFFSAVAEDDVEHFRHRDRVEPPSSEVSERNHRDREIDRARKELEEARI